MGGQLDFRGLPWDGFNSKPLERSRWPFSTLNNHGDLLNGIPPKRIAQKAQGVQTIGGANGQRGWQDDDDDDDDDDDGIHVVVNHHHHRGAYGSGVPCNLSAIYS